MSERNLNPGHPAILWQFGTAFVVKAGQQGLNDGDGVKEDRERKSAGIRDVASHLDSPSCDYIVAAPLGLLVAQ